MASIGELTATVRADISGYVGPMRQVAATNQQVAASVTSTTAPLAKVGESLTAVSAQGVNTALVFRRVEHAATLLGVEATGLGAHFGRLVAQLGPLVGGGGMFALLAVAVGLAAEAFSEWRERAAEDIKAVEDAWSNLQAKIAQADPFLELVKEREAAMVKLRQATADVAAAEARIASRRGTGAVITGGVTSDLLADLAEARIRASDAQRALDAVAEAIAHEREEIHNSHLPEHAHDLHTAADAARAAAAAERALADALDEIKRKGAEMSGEKNPVLATGIDAATENAIKKGIQSIKSAAQSTNEWAGVAQSAAQGFSHAFGDAMRGQSQGLLESIAAVLRDAILGAMEKLVEEKVFKELVSLLMPDKGLISGGVGGGGLSIVGDAIGGIFGAPSIPMAGAMASGGTIVVPLDRLPPAMSPVAIARDVLHQAVWIETARVAQANGVRLSVRF